MALGEVQQADRHDGLLFHSCDDADSLLPRRQRFRCHIATDELDRSRVWWTVSLDVL